MISSSEQHKRQSPRTGTSSGVHLVPSCVVLQCFGLSQTLCLKKKNQNNKKKKKRKKKKKLTRSTKQAPPVFHGSGDSMG